MLVLYEHGEEYHQHLLLSARQAVGQQQLTVLLEYDLVLRTHNLLARLGKQLVGKVLEPPLGVRYLGSLEGSLLVARREQLDDAVTDVHLIVQIAALQLVELPVELGLHILVGHLLGQVAVEQRTVEAAYHIEVYRGGLLGVEGHLHPLQLLDVDIDPTGQIVQLLCGTVQDGRLAYAVHATQYVHVAAQVPHDMLAPP